MELCQPHLCFGAEIDRSLCVYKQTVDRSIEAVFYDELKFLRSKVLHCHAEEWQARLAIGTPENRNGIVYSAIRRCGDTNCLGRIIGRILRHVFIFLCDHEYIPWVVDMHTVTLHMQFHERPTPRALKLCFEAWVGLVNLRRQRAAADPLRRPTRPCP